MDRCILWEMGMFNLENKCEVSMAEVSFENIKIALAIWNN